MLIPLKTVILNLIFLSYLHLIVTRVSHVAHDFTKTCQLQSACRKIKSLSFSTNLIILQKAYLAD